MDENKSKAKKDKILLPDGVTEETVKAWKERYGENKVKLATLNDDNDSFAPFDVVIRVPDRVTMGEFEKWLDKNPDKSKQILVKACLLSSKEEVLAHDDKFLAAFNAIAEILPIRKAVIKNL